MKVLEYIKGSYKEFKENVTWPTWPKLQQDTIVVAIATVILAIFLYAVDSLFASVIENVYRFLR